MMKTQNMTNSPGDIVRKRPKHEIGSPSWQSIQKQVVQHHTEKLKANPMLQDQIVLALFGYVMPFVGSSSIIVGLETLKEEPHFFGPSMCSEIRLLLYWHIVMAGIMYFRHATTRTLLGILQLWICVQCPTAGVAGIYTMATLQAGIGRAYLFTKNPAMLPSKPTMLWLLATSCYFQELAKAPVLKDAGRVRHVTFVAVKRMVGGVVACVCLAFWNGWHAGTPQMASKAFLAGADLVKSMFFASGASAEDAVDTVQHSRAVIAQLFTLGELQPIVARGAASLIAAYALLVVLDVAFRLPALLLVAGASGCRWLPHPPPSHTSGCREIHCLSATLQCSDCDACICVGAYCV
eukprot:m.712810 g.712810  ORF g.712810 m.712810 type:complete len:350 (-) comp22965_c0_seq9:130-1179(-)